MTILRTQRDGVWELRSNAWGTFLAPTVDPLADTVITQEQLDGFELNPDTPKIPAELWNRWVNLTIEMCKRGTGDLEVSCRLLRNVDDPSQYRICVPVQKVTGVSVRVESFDKAVDIETGEMIEQWPPEGWVPCGSSHSHNTMDAFFSGTDDKYELGDPGLHIVVGKIDVNTGAYELCASVTANRRRFLIEPGDVVHLDDDTQLTYHPASLDVIDVTNSFGKLASARTSVSLPTIGYNPWTTTRTFVLDNAPVQSGVSRVRAAVDDLIRTASAQGIDITNTLSDLAMEIDEAAYFTETTDKTNDPFYWTDDYVL